MICIFSAENDHIAALKVSLITNDPFSVDKGPEFRRVLHNDLSVHLTKKIEHWNTLGVTHILHNIILQ